MSSKLCKDCGLPLNSTKKFNDHHRIHDKTIGKCEICYEELEGIVKYTQKKTLCCRRVASSILKCDKCHFESNRSANMETKSKCTKRANPKKFLDVKNGIKPLLS